MGGDETAMDCDCVGDCMGDDWFCQLRCSALQCGHETVIGVGGNDAVRRARDLNPTAGQPRQEPAAPVI